MDHLELAQGIKIFAFYIIAHEKASTPEKGQNSDGQDDLDTPMLVQKTHVQNDLLHYFYTTGISYSMMGMMLCAFPPRAAVYLESLLREIHLKAHSCG